MVQKHLSYALTSPRRCRVSSVVTRQTQPPFCDCKPHIECGPLLPMRLYKILSSRKVIPPELKGCPPTDSMVFSPAFLKPNATHTLTSCQQVPLLEHKSLSMYYLEAHLGQFPSQHRSSVHKPDSHVSYHTPSPSPYPHLTSSEHSRTDQIANAPSHIAVFHSPF